MANNYITIDEGTGGVNKQFKVIQMTPKLKPSKTIKETLGGEYDASFGQVYESYTYVIRVPYIGDTTWGSYGDLLNIIRRNNPSGTPSTTFTLTDHYGTEHTNCMMSADSVDIEPLTTIIDGTSNSASYIVPITILLDPDDTITSEEYSP